MSWIRYSVTGLTMLLLASLGACSGNGSEDEEGAGPGEIGGVCGGDSDCKGGKCAAAGVCTRTCSLHSECGCAPNTTNQNIIDGACSVACVLGSCARTCKTSLECQGSTDCQATDSYFSVCL